MFSVALGTTFTFVATLGGMAQSVAKVAEAVVFDVSEDGKTGASQSIKAPTRIIAGEVIRTGSKGTASLMLNGKGSARLGPDTEVRVPSSNEKLHSLELLKGRLFLNISAQELKKREAGEFRLKTPEALLAVKGTRFFASSLNGVGVAGVHEGEVVVFTADTKQSATLDPNKAVSIQGGLLSKERPLTSEESGFSDATIRAVKDSSGKIIQASFVNVTPDIVTLLLVNGREAKVPLQRLSAEDQSLARALAQP